MMSSIWSQSGPSINFLYTSGSGWWSAANCLALLSNSAFTCNASCSVCLMRVSFSSLGSSLSMSHFKHRCVIKKSSVGKPSLISIERCFGCHMSHPIIINRKIMAKPMPSSTLVIKIWSEYCARCAFDKNNAKENPANTPKKA